MELEIQEPQKRARRKSARRSLEDICDRLEEASKDSPKNKMTVALGKIADIRMKLFDIEAAQASDDAKSKLLQAQAQATTDAETIQRLTEQLQAANNITDAMRSRPPVTQADPEAESLRRRLADAEAILKFVAKDIGSFDDGVHRKACLAIRATLALDTQARQLVELLGFSDFGAFYRGLHANESVEVLSTSYEIQTVAPERAAFCRAALATRHGVSVSPKATTSEFDGRPSTYGFTEPAPEPHFRQVIAANEKAQPKPAVPEFDPNQARAELARIGQHIEELKARQGVQV